MKRQPASPVVLGGNIWLPRIWRRWGRKVRNYGAVCVCFFGISDILLVARGIARLQKMEALE